MTPIHYFAVILQSGGTTVLLEAYLPFRQGRSAPIKRTLVIALATIGAIKVRQEIKVFVACDMSLDAYLSKKRFDLQLNKLMSGLDREGQEGQAGKDIIFHNLTGGAFKRD